MTMKTSPRAGKTSTGKGFVYLRVSTALALFSISTFFSLLAFASIPDTELNKNGVSSLTSSNATMTATTTPAPNTWSIVDSPNRHDGPRNNALRQVTCVSDSDCWSVGNYFTGSVTQALTEH